MATPEAGYASLLFMSMVLTLLDFLYCLLVAGLLSLRLSMDSWEPPRVGYPAVFLPFLLACSCLRAVKLLDWCTIEEAILWKFF